MALSVDVAMPAAAKLMADNGLAPGSVIGTGKGGRITKGDVLGVLQSGALLTPVPVVSVRPIQQSLIAKRRRVFISYRRDDSEHAVARLAAELHKSFEESQVFYDLDSIEAGADYPNVLERGLQECAAVLVVIGPNWLSAIDKQGRRRLELNDGWVRQEIATCLSDQDVRVLPILLGNIEMPRAEDLPKSLCALSRRQALNLTTRYWLSDVERLVSILRRIPGLQAGNAC